MRTSSFILALAWLLTLACSSEPPPEQQVEKTTPPEPVEKVEPVAKVEPEQPEQPEEPPKPSWDDLPPLDTSCKSDNECTPQPSCCSIPCTSNVININALPEANRRVEELCPKDRQCGSAGGCRTHEYLCVDGNCALVFHDDKNFRKRKFQ